MSERDSPYYQEILADGLDRIPKDCPKICNQIEGHQDNIVTFGRQVFIRRKKAVANFRPEKLPKMIPVAEAMEMNREAIRRYDETIKVLVDRKGILEAENECMGAFAK